MDDLRWTDPIDTDAYHGQIRTRDSRSFWVVPRLHRSSGWFVEVRADAVDGDLLERRWRPTYRAASEAVGRRRTKIARLTADEVAARHQAIDGLRSDLGIVVAHGPRSGDRSYSPEASIAGHRGSVCHLAWASAGPQTVRWSSRLSRFPDPMCSATVSVAPEQVEHLWKPWLIRPDQARPVHRWHVCALRSLRFVDGMVTADRDVRTLLSRS